MENKINIAEILRNCPQGMELYSPLCGKCVFDRLNMGTIICKKQNTQEIIFTSEGYYMLPVFNDCECILFPSKDQRDWSKFKRPFKDGDIIFTHADSLKIGLGNTWISIFKENSAKGVVTYAGIKEDGSNYYDNTDEEKGLLCSHNDIVSQRLATEEEKQKLFDAIKANGYKWNEDTKKLVPNKFDLNTLIPFESRVLIRNCKSQYWIPAFWGYQTKDCYITTFGHSNYCIPYEGNEHLLSKTDECDDYYKTWK